MHRKKATKIKRVETIKTLVIKAYKLQIESLLTELFHQLSIIYVHNFN